MKLPLLAMRNMTVLPNVTTRIEVGRAASIAALMKAQADKRPLALFTQKSESDVLIEREEQLYEVGVSATISEILKISDDVYSASVDTMERIKLVALTKTEKYTIAEVEPRPYIPIADESVAVSYRDALNDLLRDGLLINSFPEKARSIIETNADVNDKIDASFGYIKYGDKRTVLDTDDTLERVKAALTAFTMQKNYLSVLEEVAKRMGANSDEHRRENMLRAQMEAIQAELGDTRQVENKEFGDAINALAADEDIKEKLRKDLRRMSRVAASSPEFYVLDTYLTFVLSLPWGKFTKEDYDINAVRQILDADHYGLDDVKERVLEFLAVRKLVGAENNAPILCLVGPPGVGKTSFAQSIARALNKEYIHMSLGGIDDEADIRGHRKTYVGAMAGRIMTCMSKAKTSNPLFLLDEVDKINASGAKGDPSSALLEVLDSGQNKNFLDHYTEVPFDLSQVFFILTANVLSTIQKPLLDRMEIIEMSGYTADEKIEIAKRHLVAKQLKQNGLEERGITFTSSALAAIIEDYTSEAGVRNLERQIESICRKVAKKIVGGELASASEIDAACLEEFLGAPKYTHDEAVSREVGTVNGLAYTGRGGEITTVEVRLLSGGKGDVILTGSLGDVIKESAQIALSLIKSRADELHIDRDMFTKNDIHIHLPSGAVPKDGPSAGVTLATALLSAFTDCPVKGSVAMTGEITLRGKVLPIGGLKEKVMAAKRGGITEIIVPSKNRRDIVALPDNVRDGVDFVYAEDVYGVFNDACGTSL